VTPAGMTSDSWNSTCSPTTTLVEIGPSEVAIRVLENEIDETVIVAMSTLENSCSPVPVLARPAPRSRRSGWTAKRRRCGSVEQSVVGRGGFRHLSLVGHDDALPGTDIADVPVPVGGNVLL